MHLELIFSQNLSIFHSLCFQNVAWTFTLVPRFLKGLLFSCNTTYTSWIITS